MSNKDRLEVSFTSPFPDTPLSGDTERPESPSTFKEITANFMNKLPPQDYLEDALREELITIIVEIGNKREDMIVVRKGDNVDELAERFALKHSLPAQMKARLKDNIRINLANALNEANVQPPAKQDDEECPENISDEEQDPSFFQTNNGSFMAQKMTGRLPPQCSKGTFQSPSEAAKSSERLAVAKDTARPRVGAAQRNAQSALGAYTREENIGERLYREGVKEKEEREKRNEVMRKEKENQSFSFQPSINPLSKDLTRSVTNQSKLEDRLSKDKKVKEKIENMKTLKILEEKINCPFKPQIDRISSKLAESRNKAVSNIDSSSSFTSSRNKFDFLFEDARRRRLKQQRVEKFSRNNECTFRPKVDTHFATFTKPREKKPRVAEIMVNQPLHRPKTGRGPKTQRNQEGAGIGEYLYSQSRVKEKLMKVLAREKLIKDKMLRNQSYVQSQSKKIIDCKKIASFKNIFNALDNDSDGRISIRSISFDGTSFANLRTKR